MCQVIDPISFFVVATHIPYQAFRAKGVGTQFAGSQSQNDVRQGGAGVWQYSQNDPHQGVYTSVDTHKICALLASKYHREVCTNKLLSIRM